MATTMHMEITPWEIAIIMNKEIATAINTEIATVKIGAAMNSKMATICWIASKLA